MKKEKQKKIKVKRQPWFALFGTLQMLDAIANFVAMLLMLFLAMMEAGTVIEKILSIDEEWLILFFIFIIIIILFILLFYLLIAGIYFIFFIISNVLNIVSAVLINKAGRVQGNVFAQKGTTAKFVWCFILNTISIALCVFTMTYALKGVSSSSEIFSSVTFINTYKWVLISAICLSSAVLIFLIVYMAVNYKKGKQMRIVNAAQENNNPVNVNEIITPNAEVQTPEQALQNNAEQNTINTDNDKKEF